MRAGDHDNSHAAAASVSSTEAEKAIAKFFSNFVNFPIGGQQRFGLAVPLRSGFAPKEIRQIIYLTSAAAWALHRTLHLNLN